MTREERNKMRRACLRSIKPVQDAVDVVVQTYRVYATLDCGHRTSFTLSRKAYARNDWRRRRRGCFQCLQAAGYWGDVAFNAAAITKIEPLK